MPFEIQEIDIRLRVDPSSGAVQRKAAGGGAETSSDDGCCGPSEADREDMVRECVRRVLRALEASNHR